MTQAYRIGLVLLLTASPTWSQEPLCSNTVPVNVILPAWGLVRRLQSEAFVAREKRRPITVHSVSTESGPRRVLFVVENGNPMPEAARRIEAEVISAVLSKAQPSDSFALLSARGPREEVRFGDTTGLRAAVSELVNVPKGKQAGTGVLDTVLEAASWFQPPQPGDSIWLMTMGLESPHRAGFRKVQSALAESRIRVFGFLLGEVLAGYMISGMTLGRDGAFVPTSDIYPNVENAIALSLISGGMMAQENTDNPIRRYQLTDERSRQLVYESEQMYKAIAEYYVLKLDRTGPGIVIDLADPVRRQFPRAASLYPRLLPACSATVSDESQH